MLRELLRRRPQYALARYYSSAGKARSAGEYPVTEGFHVPVSSWAEDELWIMDNVIADMKRYDTDWSIVWEKICGGPVVGFSIWRKA